MIISDGYIKMAQFAKWTAEIITLKSYEEEKIGQFILFGKLNLDSTT